MNAASPPLCACSHEREAHEHLHRAMYCAFCECPAYRPRLRDLAAALLRRIKGSLS